MKIKKEEVYTRKFAIEVDIFEPLPFLLWNRLVKASANYSCERCSDKPESNNLHAHHIDRNPVNHTLVNGECLCRSCHVQHHRDAGWARESIRDEEAQEALKSIRVIR